MLCVPEKVCSDDCGGYDKCENLAALRSVVAEHKRDFWREAISGCLQTAALRITPARSCGLSPEALTDLCLPDAVEALGLCIPEGSSVRGVLFGCEDVPGWAHAAACSGTASRAPVQADGKMFPPAPHDPTTLSGRLHLEHAAKRDHGRSLATRGAGFSADQLTGVPLAAADLLSEQRKVDPLLEQGRLPRRNSQACEAAVASVAWNLATGVDRGWALFRKYVRWDKKNDD